MITQQVIYSVMNIFQNITDWINFIGRLDRDEGAAMFFTIKKTKETNNFSQNTVSII